MDNNALRVVLRHAADGDVDAIDALLRYIQPHLYAFLYVLGLNDADIDDVAQDTVLALYRNLPTYDVSQPFLPWLRGIARNRTAMFRRQAERRRKREDAWRVQIGDLAQTLEHHWDFERLHGCLEQLSVRARTIIQGRYHHDQTAEQVAEQLGMTGLAVRKALMSIRGLLRRCMEEIRA